MKVGVVLSLEFPECAVFFWIRCIQTGSPISNNKQYPLWEWITRAVIRGFFDRRTKTHFGTRAIEPK
jgi:hypothetical protein